MEEFRALSLKEVDTGDTYELAYAHSYPALHWSPDSLYLADEPWGIGVLAPAIHRVFRTFAWYGPQKVTLSQWCQVESICLDLHPEDLSVQAFFSTVRAWLNQGNRNADHFWILGV